MKFKINIYMTSNTYDENKPVGLYVLDEEKKFFCGIDDIKLLETEIEINDIDIPDSQELLLLAIDSLEDKKKQIQEKAIEEIKEIDTKLNNLKLIRHEEA